MRQDPPIDWQRHNEQQIRAFSTEELVFFCNSLLKMEDQFGPLDEYEGEWIMIALSELITRDDND